MRIRVSWAIKRIQKVEIRSVEFYIKKDYEMMINNVMFINHSKWKVVDVGPDVLKGQVLNELWWKFHSMLEKKMFVVVDLNFDINGNEVAQVQKDNKIFMSCTFPVVTWSIIFAFHFYYWVRA